MQTPHTSTDFDVDLATLRERLLEMGALAEYQVRYAVEALTRDDPHLVEKVITEEARVNALEREIDALVTQTIARRFPAGGDLRFILSVAKATRDLERIGDEAKKIAAVAQRLHLRDRIRLGQVEIVALSDVVVDMLRRALDGFARMTSGDAPAIVRQDLRADERFQAILRQLLTYMIEDPRTISPVIDLVFAAKALERVGDHAKNLAEYLVYANEGKDVRHAPVEEMERAVRS
jgi:phosphate transport system protein